MNEIIEFVKFTLVKGCNKSAFLAANAALDEWLRKQPGFVKRQLCEMSDESWLDLVHWRTRLEAKRASERIMLDLFGSHCMRMINPDSVQISYGQSHPTAVLAGEQRTVQ